MEDARTNTAADSAPKEFSLWTEDLARRFPVEAIAVMRPARERFNGRAEENAYRDSGWSAQEAMDCDLGKGRCDRIELTAVRQLAVDSLRSAISTMEQLVAIDRMPANAKGLREAREALAKIEGKH